MPFLVAVDGHRFPLRRGHTYVVGRGLDSDLILDDSACSRQHARVVLSRTSDGAFVEDLGSRNGTFLNGDLVTERVPLREGSRLQLGASVFLFRMKEEKEEIDLAETGTVAFEQEGARHTLDGGELAEYGALELIRVLFNARRNVTVHVAVPNEHAILEVREGELVFAYYGGLEGFNALVKLARQPNGIFWFVETQEDCERNITEPTLRLMAELQRCVGAAPVAKG